MNTRYGYSLVVGTAFALLVGGVSYSCTDFLTTLPQGGLNEGTLTSKQGVEGNLIAAYRALDWNTGVGGAWGSAASNWVWGSVPSDDAYKGSDANDQAPILDVELYNWNTSLAGGYLNDKWRSVFEGVVRSNATLRLLTRVLATKPGEIGATDASGIKGEAMFLRAHFHFEAWQMWGNVPYYRETDTDIRKTNVGVDVPGSIKQDLDSAIALLPDAPRNGQTGRVTKWAAMAFKGRLQMYTRDFTGALTTLRAVVASGKYKLETSFDHVWTGFKQYANGPETILAFQASVNDGQPDGNNGNYGERLNFPYVAPFCCGFHQPSQNLVNFFAVNDSGLPLALSSPTTWNTRDTSFTATTTVKVDPRLDWTVGRDNVPYKDWGLHRPSFVRDRSYSGPYSPKKNVHEKASGAQSKVGWNPAQLNSVHLHIFRYADVLLLLAEAEVEAGTVDAARLLVNQIRTRAGQTAEGCGSGSTDTTLSRVYPTCVGDDRIAVPLVGAATLGVTTNSDSLLAPWATYKIGLYTAPWADPNLARTYVHWERRLELAMEGKRFFDLRRWGTATDSLNAYIAVEKRRRAWMVNAVPFSTKHSLYPIPQVQIDLSTVGTQSTLKQNTGW